LADVEYPYNATIYIFRSLA